MVNGLSVARGDRVRSGQPLVTLETRALCRFDTDYLHAFRARLPPSSSNGTWFNAEDGAATRSGDQPDRSPAGKHRRGGTTANASAQRSLRRGNFAPDQRRRLQQQLTSAGNIVEIVVSPGQRSSRRRRCVKLARLSPLWAEIAIPASSIRGIRPGARVEIDTMRPLDRSYWCRKQRMWRPRLFWCNDGGSEYG